MRRTYDAKYKVGAKVIAWGDEPGQVLEVSESPANGEWHYKVKLGKRTSWIGERDLGQPAKDHFAQGDSSRRARLHRALDAVLDRARAKDGSSNKLSKADAELNKADAEWNKVKAEYRKAYVKWKNAEADYDKDDAEWKKAHAEHSKAIAEHDKGQADYDKAYVKWEKAYAEYSKAIAKDDRARAKDGAERGQVEQGRC